MARTGSWSLKIVLALAVAAVVWAGATALAVSVLEGRLRGEPSRPTPSTVLPAR